MAVVIVLCFVSLNLFAKDLMLADVPIVYGKESFLQRIEERTGGERTPIGLVLSGGSARALAHIGVLRYLEEIDIVPDFIVSNSMGSIVGLLYAAGLSPNQILEITASTSLETLFDLTLPLNGGILDPARFLQRVASVLGRDLRLEDLEIPVLVATEDLATKRQIQLTEGDFYTVLAASFALPVYFPPVPLDEHRLIDGGITNLVPVEIASEYTDQIILSTTFYETENLDLKNPLTVLNVSIDISKRRKGVEEMKDLEDSFIWIRSDVESISFMEFAKVTYLQEKGYEGAQAQQLALEALPKGQGVASLGPRRDELAVAIANAERAYATYEHIGRLDNSALLGIGLWSTQGSGVRAYLKDDLTLGLAYLLSKGALSAEINGGLAFDLSHNKGMYAYPAIRAHVHYYFLDHWRVAAGGAVQYDSKQKEFLFDYDALLEGRYGIGGGMSVWASQSFEGLSKKDAHSYLASTTVTLQLPTFPWLEQSSIDGTFQVFGDYQTTRLFMNPHLSFKVRDPLVGIYFTADGSGRFALDGKKNVPLFIADHFRTNKGAVISQGHDFGKEGDGENYLAVVNLGIGYQPHAYRPTFAEMFLFEESRVGIYTDLLFDGALSFSAGLEVETTLSLLGITDLGLRLYGGWDQPSNGLIWGIYLTVSH